MEKHTAEKIHRVYEKLLSDPSPVKEMAIRGNALNRKNRAVSD
jgi:hypothetical protein